MTDTADRRTVAVLGVCCASVLLVGIDTTAVNVALPAMASDLRAGVSGLSWIVDAYTLTLAALLMPAAATADQIGRKRVFLLGLGLFVLGSGLCALAPSASWLVGFRVLQAVGGCMLNPVAMAILAGAFPGSAARARAIGIWSGVTGLALALGPIVGGALVSSPLGWRWIFLLNVPIGAVALVVTARAVRESRATVPRRSDPVGQVLVAALLCGVTYAVIESGRAGWTAPATLIGLGVGAVALAGVVGYEPRRADPLLDPALFRSVPFSGAALIAVAAFATLSTFLFLNSLYLQQVRGFSALWTGLLALPLAVSSMIYGPVNGRILARRGARPCLITSGITVMAAGLVLTSVTPTTPIPWLLVAYALLGIGNVAVGAPVTHLAVAGAPPSRAGLAAGISSAARQVGATLGVAVVSVTLPGDRLGATPTGAAATHPGWWLMTGYGALILVLGLLITTRRTADPATDVPAIHPEGAPPMPSRIAVVIGSTRPTRICPTIAAWARDALQDGSTLSYELVDLADVGLPLLDEPLKAALHEYAHEHTRAWSRLVSSYDGFVFVFPQYNWGYPAAIKNALDYLYQEWHDKPASLITYGTRGGNKAAAQFIGVLHGLHMRVLDEHVEAIVTDADVDDAWQLVDVHATLAPTRLRLRAIDAQLTTALAPITQPAHLGSPT